MTTTSSGSQAEQRAEGLRLRLERLLQVTAREFDLRFEFGDRDAIGPGEIVLAVDDDHLASAEYGALKGEALHLLGHYLSQADRWAAQAHRIEGQGRPHFARLWHALEDSRLENRMVDRWPGMAKSFDRKVPPHLSGALMRLASRTRQIELGLYLFGRGHTGADYAPSVSTLLSKVQDPLERGAEGTSPADSLAAAREIYPVVGPHLRGEQRRSPPRRVQSEGESTLPEGEQPREAAKKMEDSQTADFQTEDPGQIGLEGQTRAFPQWIRPGSAPWFERGLGEKKIHPTAVKTDRETIVVPEPGPAEAYRRLRTEVEREAGTLNRRLKQRIRENLYLRYGGRYRSGKLDMARLWKQRTGSYRLFQRRVHRSEREIAFSLLVDESASMKRANKIQLAQKAAVMLGEALDPLGVPIEIIGFSTAQYEAQAAMAANLRPPHEFRTMRCSPLEHRLYKRFDESFAATCRRLVNVEPRCNNWDEEHLLFAFRRLQRQRARRQVMIVLSDGQPNGDADHLIRMVARLQRLGCWVIGVGIGADYVKQIYDPAIVVSDFLQLAAALAEAVARPFENGARRRAA